MNKFLIKELKHTRMIGGGNYIIYETDNLVINVLETEKISLNFRFRPGTCPFIMIFVFKSFITSNIIPHFSS